MRYFKLTVNGKEYTDTGEYPNTPPGYTEIPFDEFVNLSKQTGQWDSYSPAIKAGGGDRYTIGPNGQFMTKEAAANFSPSPQEYARGIQPTGSGVAPGGSTLPKAPSGELLSATVGNVTPPTVNLQPGDTGAEVKKLQDYLVSKGLMTQAQVDTGYGTYGPQTTKAVKALQESLGVDNSTGVGYWGPRTMKATNTVPIEEGVSTVENSNVLGSEGVPNNDISNQTYDALIAGDPLLSDYFSDPQTKAEFSKLPPELQGTYLQMARTASQAIEAGKVINPDLVQVTPAQLSEFYSQAETEMDPYYKEQFGLLKGDLERSVERLTEDYTKQATRSEEPFKQKLANQAQTESEQGTVYSSERNRREASAILGQNQALGDLAEGAQRSVQDLGVGFEKVAGSDMARTLNLPSIQNYQATTQGYTPSATRNLYVPLGGVTGSGQRERATALKTRQNELEGAYRKSRNLDLAKL